MIPEDDFKTRLLAHAQTAVERAGRASSEAATNQYLVLPFLQVLGYDPLDPDEVIPEAHASFSDKFKNRVDFAICKDGVPVVAIESKKVGVLGEGHRGEIKGYFNALQSVKLGILTDGLIWELFTDTAAENVMDGEPFAILNLAAVAKDGIADATLDAFSRIRNGTFDPADVGADAKRKMYTAAYADALERSFQQPSEVLVRALMDLVGIEGRRTTRLVDEHTPIVADAIASFFDRKLLERVGFASRQDIVRMPAAVPAPVAVAPEAEDAFEVLSGDAESGIITTDTERTVYEYVRYRLAFLVAGDEEMYRRLDHLYPVDFKTTFSVCYKQQRKGKLFNFAESPNAAPRYRFEFVATGESLATDSLPEIDALLLASFRKRVEELG